MESNNSVHIIIDGKTCLGAPGETILTVARRYGIDIPTLCYDPRLPPYGSCLVCAVEVKGMAKLPLACTALISEGMEVTTDNPKVFAARKNALELLLSNHYADCRGPCYDACPADVDVQGYLALANQGKYLEALALIRQTNPLPLVCGRVCVRYCEANCRRQDVDNKVAINFIKRYCTDLEYDNLDAPVVAAKNGRKVAVIGGGPAGLTAAYFLAKWGYTVKIFDTQPKLGGMVRYGIPDYRLPQDLLDKEINYLLAHGIEVQTNIRLGRDITLDGLKADGFDAIYLAMGCQAAKSMRVKGEDTPGVLGGVEFLDQVNKEGPMEMKGHVVVVGGGNTAIDAARTSLRCGASKVSILYRRTLAEMPADPEEIEDAIDEGIDIQYLVAPLEVLSQDGYLKSIRVQQMRLGEPDESGRRRPVPVEGGEQEIPCNYIIAAIGQDAVLDSLKGNAMGDVETTRWNTIVADEQTFATGIAGVFAGGDVHLGPKAAVDAIGAGRKAAKVMDVWLSKGELKPAYTEFLSKKKNLGDIPQSFLDTFEKSERAKSRKDPAESRAATFQEMDHGITGEQAACETSRCMVCGCQSVFTCDLKAYATTYAVNQQRFDGKASKYKVDDRHPYLRYDANKCIVCGRCVRTCSDLVGQSALGFVNRGFDMVVRPALDRPLHETTCISCGNCVESCPTGALEFKLPFPKPGPFATVAYDSVCNHCGTGCAIQFNKRDEDIWWVTATPRDTHTKAELCMRGHFGHRNLLTRNRFIEPFLTAAGSVKTETNLDAAIAAAVKGLTAAAAAHGPKSLAFLVSPKATNEEIFLVRKLAQRLGSPFVASLYDLARTDTKRTLTSMLGATASTLSIETAKKADVIVVINAAVETENPVLAMGLTQAAKRGAALVRISAEPGDLDRFALASLRSKRGSNTVLLKAVAAWMLANGGMDKAFIESRTEGFDAFAQSLTPDLDKAPAATGVPAGDIIELARRISDPQTKVVFVYNVDSTLEKAPGDLQMLADILLLAGKLGVPGSGLLLSHEHSNYQGLSDICPLDDATLETMKAALENGDIKGLFIFGEDMAADETLKKHLDAVPFVAAVDQFFSDTVQQASVGIPGTAYAESEGSVTSLERSVRAFAPVFAPKAGITGFEVLARMYAQATAGQVMDIRKVREAIAAEVPGYGPLAGLAAGSRFFWNETPQGGETLFSSRFLTKSGKATFCPVPDDGPGVVRVKIPFSGIDRLAVAMKAAVKEGKTL